LNELLAEQAEAAELGRDALDGAMQAARLTERLLAAGGRQARHPEPVELDALLPILAAVIGADLGPAVEVAVEIAEPLPPVLADPAQLQQILAELAANAAAAMPAGGRFALIAGPVRLDGADHVRLEVRDTGPGMPPDVLARAFEPFFTTKRGERGAGLGLSLVHSLVRQSGGHVELSSAPGAGTSVRVYLPGCPPDCPPS
jgi:signal transduction histidine kinase